MDTVFDETFVDETRLRRLISANEPAGLDPYIAVPSFGQPYHMGTLAARLGNFAQHASGLLVPASAVTRAAPIDYISSYITFTQLTGHRGGGIEDLRALLGRLPLKASLHAVAQAMAVIRDPGAGKSIRGLDESAPQFFAEPYKTKLRNLINQGSIIHAPQLLMVLAKLMIAYCPDDVAPESAARISLPHLVIAVADCLEVDDLEPTAQAPIPLMSDVSLELMANDYFNTNYRHDSQLALFQRRWIELPRERRSKHHGRPLDEAFADATGSSLGDFAAIAIALWSSCAAGKPVVECHSFLLSHGWPTERIERVLEFIATPADRLRSTARAWVENHSLDWYFTPLALFPAVRFGNDLLVLDADGVLRRCLGWLPLEDLKFGLQRQGRAAEIPSIVRAFDDYTEVYVTDTFRSIAGEENAKRVFTETELRSKYKSGKTADIAIDYGDSWIVVEITRAQNRRDTAHAVSMEAMIRDRDVVVGESRQIAATVAAIQTNQAQLTGAAPDRPGTFFPIVVFAEGFTNNLIMTTLVREELQRLGLLQGPGIAALEIMDVVELDMIEGACEEGGPSFPQILRMKATSNFSADSVGRFILALRP